MLSLVTGGGSLKPSGLSFPGTYKVSNLSFSLDERA